MAIIRRSIAPTYRPSPRLRAIGTYLLILVLLIGVVYCAFQLVAAITYQAPPVPPPCPHCIWV